MENDPKNKTENTPKGDSSELTRRKLLKVTAVGALIAVTGLHVVFRKSKPKEAFASTEIMIEGPFNEYGYFRPEDLGREDLKKLNSDFKLETLILDEGKHGDNVMISFTFTGEEAPNRKMKVFLAVYDKEGKVIGGAENTFDDPRITAKEEVPLSIKLTRFPTATLSAKIPKNIDISRIDRVEITAQKI